MTVNYQYPRARRVGLGFLDVPPEFGSETRSFGTPRGPHVFLAPVVTLLVHLDNWTLDLSLALYCIVFISIVRVLLYVSLEDNDVSKVFLVTD